MSLRAEWAGFLRWNGSKRSALRHAHPLEGVTTKGSPQSYPSSHQPQTNASGRLQPANASAQLGEDALLRNKANLAVRHGHIRGRILAEEDGVALADTHLQHRVAHIRCKPINCKLRAAQRMSTSSCFITNTNMPPRVILEASDHPPSHPLRQPVPCQPVRHGSALCLLSSG